MMQLKNKVTYKVTNPNRRTYIVQGHMLKRNESIYLDTINFTEPSLVVEKIQPTKKKPSKVEVKKEIFNKFEDKIGDKE